MSGAPWGKDGHHLRKAIARYKNKVEELSTKHFHDLRGTAATKFYIANFPIRVIAEILAWDEETVEKIIWRYVGRAAATQAMIRQTDSSSSVKPTVKLLGEKR